MNTENIRIVDFWHPDTPDKPIKGIFHKWIEKDNKTLAIIEEFYGGRIAFIPTTQMSFLNYYKTKDFWLEIQHKPGV